MTDFRPRDCYRGDGTQKIAFGTRKEAKKIARERGHDTHAYRCSYCGHYHLGHRRDQ